MEVVPLLLLVAAFIVFALAALGVDSTRVGLAPLGLALWVGERIYQVVT